MKALIFGIGTFLILTTSHLEANAPTEFRLGVVDFQRALTGVEEGKAAAAKLQKEGLAKEAELKKKGEKLQTMNTEMVDLQNKERSMLLKGAEVNKLRQLEENFRKQVMEFDQSRAAAGQDAAEKENQAKADILRKLKVVVEDLGRSGSFTMVLEKASGLLYAAEATELTEKVIQNYNAKFKGGSAKEGKKEK
ncbi:MAG: hypothetical protein JWQ35_2227 [Bacteriovoracaceae bacterium]|nr:hypothetical protein [Bacteriovoracaceae bacterium]